jgi:hypothetical protein
VFKIVRSRKKSRDLSRSPFIPAPSSEQKAKKKRVGRKEGRRRKGRE